MVQLTFGCLVRPGSDLREKESSGENSELTTGMIILVSVSDLKRRLREADERRETLIAQHQIRLNSLNEELDSVKAELREKDSEVRTQELTGPLTSRVVVSPHT